MQLLQRIFGIALALALAAAAVVFASIVLAIAAAVALVAGGWLWWKTRHLRRGASAVHRRRHADVIEGEYRVEQDSHRIGPDRR